MHNNKVRNDKTSKVLMSLVKMAEKEFVPSIGPIKGKIVAKIVKKYKPRNILEIGTLYGYSAILMASMLPSSDGKVVTIEINKSVAEAANKNIEDAGLSDKIAIIIGNALDVIPKLDQRFQLMFLDAAKDEYLGYLKSAEKKCLEKGTVVVADNVKVSKNEMLDYLEYVRYSGLYKSKTIETILEFTPNIKDAIELSIKIDQMKK
ncbi:MAG: methyltransferase domain-containing protein, partial [Nitrosopumilales archaeon]